MSSSGWLHSYNRSLSYTSDGHFVAFRADGKAYTFTNVSSVWFPVVDVNLKLTANSSNWLLTAEDGSVETYNRSGQLISIKSITGATQTVSYNTYGRVSTITHSNGRSLILTYDSSYRLAAMQDTAGGIYTYNFNSTTGNLDSVTYPDKTTRTYKYNETANLPTGVYFLNALTGIIDENGNRYATYQYDSQGRAIVSQHNVVTQTGTQAVEKLSISWGTNPDGSSNTTVTDALNTARTINLSIVQGVAKSGGQSIQIPGGNVINSNITYDPNGNIASSTDFNGNLSCYLYDQTRNLELYRLEGLSAASASCPTTAAGFTGYSLASQPAPDLHHLEPQLPLPRPNHRSRTANHLRLLPQRHPANPDRYRHQPGCQPQLEYVY